MKKSILTIFTVLLFGIYANAQQSTLMVYNYSPYFLEARIEANGLNGSCYPRISSNDYSNYNITFPLQVVEVLSLLNIQNIIRDPLLIRQLISGLYKPRQLILQYGGLLVMLNSPIPVLLQPVQIGQTV